MQHRCNGKRAVATDDNQRIEAKVFESLFAFFDTIWCVKWAATASAKNCAASGQDSAHIAGLQVDVSLLKHAVPCIIETKNFVTFDIGALTNDCSNDRV